MAFIVDTKRRDDRRIKSNISGQKPTCVIKIFPWENPGIFDLQVLNLANDGGLFKTGLKSKDKTARTRKPSIIDNDIVRCSINKSKNSSSGGFSFILKRGNSNDKGQKVSDTQIDYLRLISPGDWVTIYMKSNGEIDVNSNSSDSGLKLVGIIENVRYVEIDDPTLGRPRLEYIVTGRDFGKILESDIYFNPFVASDPEFQQLMGAKFAVEANAQFGKSENKSPDQVIKAMLKYYVGGGLANTSNASQLWYVPGPIAKLFGSGKTSETNSVPFYDILNKNYIGLQKYDASGSFQGTNKLLGKIIMITAPAAGTVWDAMKTYGNMLLNEFVVDLKKTSKIGTAKDGSPIYTLEPCIQLRQLPYSTSTSSEISPFKNGRNAALHKVVSENEKTLFVNLPRHTIHSTDIKQKNVGKSDFERVNTIIVTPSFFNSEPFQQAYRMAVNVPSIQRYGTKLLNTQTAYGAEKEEFLTHATKCINLLSDFFLQAHLLYNGTIVADGTDDFVEVGQNLFIDDIAQLYHIEGISYIYEINQGDGGTTYDTEFQISRGQRVESGTTNFIDNSVNGESVEVYSTIVSNALENIRNNTKKDEPK